MHLHKFLGVLVGTGLVCAALTSLPRIPHPAAADGGSMKTQSFSVDVTTDVRGPSFEGPEQGSASLDAARRSVGVASISFTDINAGLTGVFEGSAAWGDYDNDGDLDILLTGLSGNPSDPYLWVYRNDGGGVFTDIDVALAGLGSSSEVGDRTLQNFVFWATWGDYDNDGDLDILWTGSGVCRNDGNGVFTKIYTGVPGTADGSAAWGDYDNDGDLDVLLAGSSWSRVYRNDGPGAFTEIDAGLLGVAWGSAAWGDYDNDGDLDILLTGIGKSMAGETISRVYRNDGDGVFTDIEAGLPGVFYGSTAWGDYDNDGDLDILLTGAPSYEYENVSRVYRNDGDGVFTDIAAGLPGVMASSVAWGDYDNDGDLDILLSGHTAVPGQVSRVYRNDGGGVFTDISAGLPGVFWAAAAWGDYDNDGDLDLLLGGGRGGGAFIARVYRNDGASANAPPMAPSGLATHLEGDRATLSWSASMDDHTPAAGLSYNVRLGTTPGGNEICSAMANSGNGYRRVVQLGNAQMRTSWTVSLPPSVPRFYWSVQAVDEAFAGSQFGQEQTSGGVTFTDIAAGLPGVEYSSVAWGDYDNDGDLDVVLTGYTGSAFFSEVYRNDGGGIFTDAHAGLPGVDAGSVAWGDYDNDGDLDILLMGYLGSQFLSRVYRNDGGGAFTDIDAGLPGAYAGSAAWGDYDNDGDLDILLTGDTTVTPPTAPLSRIYRNDGSGVFTDIEAGLPGVMHSSVAWGDYDDDGDLDIILTGYTGSGDVSRVYRNDGAGVFTDIDAGLPGVDQGSVAWGDYDNDGDLDLLLCGLAWTGWISRVYRNEGAGVFTDIEAGLPGLFEGSVAWGDYDNDGDLDILLTGATSFWPPYLSRVYRNEGAGVFTDIEAGLPGVYSSSVAWGDYDNDGDLDVLMTGNTNAEVISHVYRNDGALANTPPVAPGNPTTHLTHGQVTLSWSASTDAQTPSPGLSYNLRIGSTPSASDICSAMANLENGYRRVVQLGNAQERTSWTVNLPPGLGTFYWSVQALDGAFAGSPFCEEQVVTPAVPGPVLFWPQIEFETGNGPWSLAIADLNHNGWQDLAVTNVAGSPCGNSVSVMIGHGDGMFFSRTDYETGDCPLSVAAGDVNCDGEPDLVLANSSSNTLSVLLGSGNGPFRPKADFPTGDSPYCVATSDLNGDGRLDLAVANNAASTVSVLIGNGDGVFGAKTDYATGDNPCAVVIADANRDGRLDLVLACHQSHAVSVLLGNGDGTFAPRSDYPTASYPYSLDVGDVNLDGRVDLAVACQEFGVSDAVSVLLGNGDGTFQPGRDIEIEGAMPLSVAIGDLNLDGAPDLAVACYSPHVVSVFAGDGYGAFPRRTDFEVGSGPTCVRIGQLNGDALPDMVVVNYGANTLSVLLNRWGLVPVTVENLAAFASEGHVALTWRLSDAAQRDLQGIDIERSLSVQGPYLKRTTTCLEPRVEMSFEDVSAEKDDGYWYRLVLLLRDGSRSIAGPVNVQLGFGAPRRTALHQPFEPDGGGPIQIRYTIADTRTPVRLTIYDVRGREVWSLARGLGGSGDHAQTWDRRDHSGARVSRGVYFVQLEAGGVMASRKLVLLHR